MSSDHVVVSAIAHLRPVLEFDPFEHRAGRPSPKEPPEVAPQAWADFWVESLADAGITGVTPLPGTWVVPLEDVQSPVLLEHVIRLHGGEPTLLDLFQSLGGPFDPASGMNAEGELVYEGFTPLRGGFALSIEAPGAAPALALTPECCGDLSHWRSWQNGARATEDGWTGIWIGHPEARVRRFGGDLLLQKVLEGGDPSGPELRFGSSSLVTAVEQVERELRTFVGRLLPVVEPAVRAAGITGEGLDPSALARRIAEHMAGLAEFELD